MAMFKRSGKKLIAKFISKFLSYRYLLIFRMNRTTYISDPLPVVGRHQLYSDTDERKLLLLNALRIDPAAFSLQAFLPMHDVRQQHWRISDR